MKNDIKFDFEDVKILPTSVNRGSGSCYDTIIEAFLKRNVPFSKVKVDGIKAQYLVTQFKKRIFRKGYKNIGVKSVNGECYFLKEIKIEIHKEPLKK